VPRVLSDNDIAGFRDRLCDLATRLIAERGPDNFNMRMLAAEMGVSAMTPYRYFRDKDEILSMIRARAFSRLADQLEQALSMPGSLPERSTAVIRAYVRFALEEQTCYRLIFDFSNRNTSPCLLGQPAWAGAAASDRQAERRFRHDIARDGPHSRKRLSRQNVRLIVIRQVRPIPGSAARLA